MKIVIIALYKVYPPSFGAAVVPYNILKYLKGEKFLIQIGEKNDCKKLKYGTVITIDEKSRGKLDKFIKMNCLLNKIKKKIDKINPELIIFEGAASWSFYYLLLFKKLKKFRIIYHDHNVEYELRKQKGNFLINYVTYLSEKFLLKNSYKAFVVSERDRNLIKKIYGLRVGVLPNGADICKFNKINNKNLKAIRVKYGFGKINILFIGIPIYRPNKEALDFLINIIFPKLLKKNKNVKLVVTGGKLDKKKDFIINPGNVDCEELPKIIKVCDICVAPIISGSGTRLKILEYMAAGKPVISTSKGAEGINVENRKNILIENDISKFANKILLLIKNKGFSKRLGKNGKKLVQQNYSWKEIVNKFQRELV